MIVEVIGPSGAGKTTLCGQIVRALTANGLPAARRHLRIGGATSARTRLTLAAAAVRHPGIVLAVAEVGRLRRSAASGADMAVRVDRRNALPLARKGVHLVDEGPWHLFCFERSQGRCSGFVPPSPDALVVLDVEDHVAAARVAKRSGGVAPSVIQEEGRERAAAYSASLDEVIGSASCPVLRYESQEETVIRVARWILQSMSHAGEIG